MATDKAWREAGLKPREFACFRCFVRWLGRSVVATDFVDCPANGVVFVALQLNGGRIRSIDLPVEER